MARRPGLLELAQEKVLVLDGAMGTMIQRAAPADDDFRGLEGCNEILVETRPDLIIDIHAAYFDAGCDVVETNTFGANGVVLAEYGIADRTEELNRIAAALAREAAADFSTPDRPRYVLGSIGPGTRLPSLGHIEFLDLKAAFEPQVRGLLAGGADAVCIETCQDLLQVKAALLAARDAFQATGRSVPIIVSVTIESTGTMLVGADVQAAVASLWPMAPDVLGMNCATGPGEMQRHAEHLSRFGPARIMAMPNAGLPENVGGELVYRMGPEELADWIEGFVRDLGFGVVGGCCGTTPDHLRAVAERVGSLPAPRREGTRRAEAASLYQAVTLTQEPAPLMVGERTNANGSREFRERLLADDLPGMVAVGREQEQGGAHLLDVCVAYVGRDERADMNRLIPELARDVRLPLVIDSTDHRVIEGALQRHGGRCVINSINLEDGRERLDQVAALAKRYGAALVALVIDEDGMATDRARKLAVAERIFEICTEEHGLLPQDLIFDMLTFTVASGDEASRRAAVDTLDAIAEWKTRHPDTLTILGVSNVSFGLRPASRRVLNSVFLHMAVERGLDQAIVNARGILPLYRLDEGLLDGARRLLLDDRTEGDPLEAYMALFQDGAGRLARDDEEQEALSPPERVHRMVVDGDRKGLEERLDVLLDGGTAPVTVINEVLIGAMREVGELFGSGQMQLPFVLKSAEVMKAAVSYLEGFMAQADRQDLGTLVLATVKGDVHDIGKNLVDIIVSNNGYRVVNLGIKVPVEQMIAACEEHGAMALGMSGLLVKSTVIMKENLEEMRRRGIALPVLLGGAALNRPFVEDDLRGVYGPAVFYCRDAFAGLEALRGLDPAAERAPSDAPPAASKPRIYTATDGGGDEVPAPTVDRSVVIPTPPFLGSRLLPEIPLDEVFELLNETTLFRGQWRYRRGTMTREAHDALIDTRVRPLLEAMKAEALEKGLLRPTGVYGYWPCRSEGRDLVILDPSTRAEATRFTFPRKRSAPHACISDSFDPVREDVVGLFVVTVGPAAQEKVQALFEGDAYQDYLHWHGLAVETAEATAEWLHRRMRIELDILEGDRGGTQAMVRQGYRGSRYSFGYPACPDLESQGPLFELLAPDRVGVTLTEGWQMVPEQSVSAIVVHHPDARYFNLD